MRRFFDPPRRSAVARKQGRGPRRQGGHDAGGGERDAGMLSSLGNQARLRACRHAQESAAAEALHEPGVPLNAATRAGMEARFGVDFSAVRLHHGERARRGARALNANAFTMGTHVVFEHASLAPENRAHRELLAHELAHVLQQTRGAARAPGNETAAALERDADNAAQRVGSGRGARVTQTSPLGVQRQPKKRNVAPDLPPALLEEMKKYGLATDAPEGLVISGGDVDPALAAAAVEFLKKGKLPRAVDPSNLLKFPFPSPDAPTVDFRTTAPFPLGPSLWPPMNLKPSPKPHAAKTPAPRPGVKPAAVPTVTSPDGLSVTQDQIDALDDEQLYARMKDTLVWLRAHKESSRKVEQAARYYAALSTAYAKRKTELELRRAYFGPKRDVDQKLRDSAAVLNLSQELAPAFAALGASVEFPPEVMAALPGRDEEFHDELVPARIGEGGSGWTSLGATAPEADPYYLDNFTGFSYDAIAQSYVLKFPDGAEAQVPRAVIDNPDFAASLAKQSAATGIQAFKARGSAATGIHVPPRLDPGTLPKLYATIQANKEAIRGADMGWFVGRNLLTYEDVPGAETINKATFGLMLLKAGVPLGMGVRSKLGGGPKTPSPGGEPFEVRLPYKPVPANDVLPEIPWLSKSQIDQFLGGRPGPFPANDVNLLPQPAVRTRGGAVSIFLQQPAPQLRLLPGGAEPGASALDIPWNAPVASAGTKGGGGDVSGGGGFGWRWSAPTSDVSGSRISFGGTWSAQARRAQTAKAKQEALQKQIDAEIDRINSRRGEISAEEWKDQRAGLTKRLYNLREQQHALQLAQAEPGAVVLTQVKILGVNKSGAFKPTEEITGSGEGRIPDVGVLKPRGKLTLIDSKTANEILESIKKRGAAGLKASSNIGKQVAKENELRAYGGDWVLEGTDPITGEKVWFTMSPSEVDNSRPVAYGQTPD